MTKSELDWKNEELSARYDGEDLPHANMSFQEDEKEHLQAWSLIGATMRQELASEVNLSLADKIMAEIEQEETPVVSEQTEIETPRYKLLNMFRKVGFVLTQTAIAASIAMVTVIGYQTYNAEENLSLDKAPVAALGPVSNVNLASYQSAPNNNIIRLGDSAYAGNDGLNAAKKAEIRNLQNHEMELINDYIRLYVSSPSAQ